MKKKKEGIMNEEGTKKGRDVTWMLQHGKWRRNGGEREEKGRRKGREREEKGERKGRKRVSM
jgi:hypothetical protein